MRIIFSFLFLAFLSLSSEVQAQLNIEQEVYTFAGSSRGTQNGTGTNAKFQSIKGIAVDDDGNIFVAEEGYHTIRKITPDGVVSTFVGSTAGYADGTGTSAQFENPVGMCVDASGNLYVADVTNHKIRKVTPSGVVTTVAGSSQGSFDGTGTDAKFNTPYAVAIDVSGNLYVADFGNHRIRKISTGGVVSTFAAVFRPSSIDVDVNGNVYATHWNSNGIHRITPSGVVSNLAGFNGRGYQDGPGSSAKFDSSWDMAVDVNGNVYLCDEINATIRKITPSGEVSKFAGTGIGRGTGFQDGPLSTSKFCYPRAITIDKQGTLIIADNCNFKIRKIEPTDLQAFFRTSRYGTTQISTTGASDGEIQTLVVGGTPPYKYSWSGPSKAKKGSPAGLVAGSYFVTITDSYDQTVKLGPINLFEP
jgi:sugar lactone lactonase YvrE